MNDIDQIRNLLARYCHAVDDDDLETLVELFTEDIEIEEDGSVLTPRDNYIDMIRRFQAAVAKSDVIADKHLLSNSWINVSGDEATAVSDVVVIKCDQEGWRIASSGRYSDQIVKIDGQWMFKRRVIDFIGLTDKTRLALKAEAGIPLQE